MMSVKKDKAEVGITTIVLSGFFLLLFTLLNIAITGADIASRSALSYPYGRKLH